MAMAGQQLGRNDRHVLRARLSIGADAPRHRVAFNIEEALRLCSLPGENEGRAYYFRHLHVRGLPEDGDRRAWLDAFQHALLELARNAVHGADGAARTAEAVFFANEQEACESLLAMILRRRPATAWFWPSVNGLPAGASPKMHIAAVIEKLLRSPASWVAVAAAVFSAIEQSEPGVLLNLLPNALVRRWLSELGNEKAVLHEVAPVRFSTSMRAGIGRAAAAFGPEDPRVLWLASLAVVLVCPSDLERGAIASRARLSLRTIGPIDPVPPMWLGAERAAPARRTTISERPNPRLDNTTSENDGPIFASPNDPRSWSSERESIPPAENEKPNLASPNDLRISSGGDEAVPDGAGEIGAPPMAAPCSRGAADSEPAPRNAGPRQDRCFGQATRGAGLYFLLNALGQLKKGDDEFDLGFLARFFQRAARHAGIESDDPILLWTFVTLDQTDLDVVDERRLRIWLLKVRRWCWRSGKISVREIVRRPGWITLTRTDLDVSLALDLADIRIRRIGLDLDPGWLPWFGRVVRFHYLYGGELDA